jgi:hypothetical protein
MTRVTFIVLFIASVGFCQLMPKPATSKSDSLQLKEEAKPLVYVDSAGPGKNNALMDVTASMDSREYSSDSTVGTIIGIGAEFVGDMVKGMLSPNSAEADAVELERTRR